MDADPSQPAHCVQPEGGVPMLHQWTYGLIFGPEPPGLMIEPNIPAHWRVCQLCGRQEQQQGSQWVCVWPTGGSDAVHQD